MKATKIFLLLSLFFLTLNCRDNDNASEPTTIVGNGSW